LALLGVASFSFGWIQMLKDNVLFLKEAILEFQATGTIFPTSRWAAEALITPLLSRKSRKPLKILELGPGTGSVTVPILENMQAGDELVVCEINHRFMEALQERLSKNQHYLRIQDRVEFYCCPMQELPETERFDVIVCAIPFSNLDLGTVQEIFSKLRRMSHEETVMTFYEYMGLRSIGKVVSPQKRRERLKQIDSFFNSIYSNHLCDKIKVYLNVLPIHIYTLRDLHELPVAA
jgi:phospholipid N-methyltransferase